METDAPPTAGVRARQPIHRFPLSACTVIHPATVFLNLTRHTHASQVVGRDYDYKKTDSEMAAKEGLSALQESGKGAAAEEPPAKRAKSS